MADGGSWAIKEGEHSGTYAADELNAIISVLGSAIRIAAAKGLGMRAITGRALGEKIQEQCPTWQWGALVCFPHETVASHIAMPCLATISLRVTWDAVLDKTSGPMIVLVYKVCETPTKEDAERNLELNGACLETRWEVICAHEIVLKDLLKAPRAAVGDLPKEAKKEITKKIRGRKETKDGTLKKTKKMNKK